MIKAGDEIQIRPEWQDAGDRDYRWFAVEDAIEGFTLRVRAVHRDPNHSSHQHRFQPIHTVTLDQIEPA